MADISEFRRLIKYGILQASDSGSLLCDIFVFIYFSINWRQEIRMKPQNHVIFALLTISFLQKSLDVPFYLYYLRWGVVAKESDTFCDIWNWLDYSFISSSLHLLTWCCIERHLFIFHSTLMKQKGYLVILHYLPMIGSMTYIFLFYAGTIFYPPSCSNQWDYKLPLCGAACYTYLSSWGTFDWIFHYGTPILIIVFSNTFLIIRIFWRKIRRQRSIERKRERRLLLQLVFISVLFLTLASPLVTVGVIQALWIPMFMSEIQYDYFYYMAYFSNQFLPFVIIGSLPKMRREIRKIAHYIKHRCLSRPNPAQIHPIRMMITAAGDYSATLAVHVRSSS